MVRFIREKLLARDPDPALLLGIAVAVAALARIAAIVLFGHTDINTNIWEYGDQARCAIRTGGDLCQTFVVPPNDPYPSAYMPPLLSYVWLVLFKVVGDDPLARGLFLGLDAVLGVLDVVLLFKLARQWRLSTWTAFFAALILAVYPTFVFVAATYHQTQLSVLLLLLLATLATSALEAPRFPYKDAAWLGLVSGLAALNRSEMLIIAPAIIFMAAVIKRAPVQLALAAAVMVLVLTPWTVRNYVTFHRVIPGAQSAGYNLWKGFNPYTNGSGNMTEIDGGPGDKARNAIRDAVPRGANYETRLQDSYNQVFKQYLATAGAPRLAQLTLTKVALLWGFDWTDTEVTGRPAYRLPWFLINALVAVGAVIAIAGRKISWTGTLVGGALLALLTAAYAATAVHARYRMHIEPFLFILAGVALDAALVKVLRPGARAVEAAA